MNWYYNNSGAAEGPMDEQAMTALVREKKLSAESLVWHAGLEAWQTVAQLTPPWWADKPAPAVETNSVPDKKEAAGRRLAGPMAPTADAAETKETGGFLKRLFRIGKKKN